MASVPTWNLRRWATSIGCDECRLSGPPEAAALSEAAHRGQRGSLLSELTMPLHLQASHRPCSKWRLASMYWFAVKAFSEKMIMWLAPITTSVPSCATVPEVMTAPSTTMGLVSETQLTCHRPCSSDRNIA